MDGKEGDDKSQEEYESVLLFLALIYIGTMDSNRELGSNASTFCRAVSWAKNVLSSQVTLPSAITNLFSRARM